MSNTQITRQIGEHLVVSELGRHGIIATPFAGNMPYFDVVALTPNGQSIYIQVKAINKGDWQLKAHHFIIIDKLPDKQSKSGLRAVPISPLVFVLIKIIGAGKDEFYILPYAAVQQIVYQNYRRLTGSSTHFALRPSMVKSFQVNNLSGIHAAIKERAQQECEVGSAPG